MPEYQMDKSGKVYVEGLRNGLRGVPAGAQPFSTVLFDDLDSFTQGFIEAAFFTSEEELVETAEREGEHGDGWLAAGKGFSDLAPDTLAAIIADCKAWQEENRGLLVEAYSHSFLDPRDPRGYSEEQAGRDYWFTRNGHGVGFWDRRQLERPSVSSPKGETIGDKLSDACRHQSVDLYLGDDGKIYLS